MTKRKQAERSAETSHEWGQLAGSIGPRIRLLHNVLAARSIAALEGYGLPTGSHTVLSLIAANPGSTQTELAEAAGLNKSALVGIVDELEKRGFAARVRSPSDRRRNHLTVTPEGEAEMKAMFARVDPGEVSIREALGPRDHALLLNLLDRAYAALD
jgi:DNA-binding MarR family transcriptional regulator